MIAMYQMIDADREYDVREKKRNKSDLQNCHQEALQSKPLQSSTDTLWK